MKETLPLKKFGTDLNTRALADEIFSQVKEGTNISIDFEGVNTATPSFCHEMLVVIKNKKIHGEFVNVNGNIQSQIGKASGLILGPQ